MLKYSWRKIFCSIKNTKFIYQAFVNLFVDITLSFSDSSLNSLSTSTGFVLFEVTFLFKYFSLLSKSVFLTKSAKSFLLAKFACANLEVKFSGVNSLNSWVAI